MLDDNFKYLMAIVDQQNLSRLPDMAQCVNSAAHAVLSAMHLRFPYFNCRYQEKLQHNLMLLAKIADGNPLGAPAGGTQVGLKLWAHNIIR